MKKLLVLLTMGVVLAFTCSIASAVGLTMGWSSSAAIDDCPTSAASSADHTSLCTSNAGSSIIIGAVIAPPGLVQVVGQTVIVDYQDCPATGAQQLSDWWNFNTDATQGPIGCRGNPTSSVNLTMSFDPINRDDGICNDLWQLNASSAYSYQPNLPAPGRGHLTMVGAVPAANGGPMTAGLP